MAEVYNKILKIPLIIFSYLLLGVAVVTSMTCVIWFSWEVTLEILFAGNIEGQSAPFDCGTNQRVDLQD